MSGKKTSTESWFYLAVHQVVFIAMGTLYIMKGNNLSVFKRNSDMNYVREGSKRDYFKLNFSIYSI